MVSILNRINMTLHKGFRRALEREARGTRGNAKVGNLSVRDIVHESCGHTVRSGDKKTTPRLHRTMDENGAERSILVTSPLPANSGSTASLLFQVESIPVLGG